MEVGWKMEFFWGKSLTPLTIFTKSPFLNFFNVLNTSMFRVNSI